MYKESKTNAGNHFGFYISSGQPLKLFVEDQGLRDPVVDRMLGLCLTEGYSYRVWGVECRARSLDLRCRVCTREKGVVGCEV